MIIQIFKFNLQSLDGQWCLWTTEGDFTKLAISAAFQIPGFSQISPLHCSWKLSAIPWEMYLPAASTLCWFPTYFSYLLDSKRAKSEP